MNEDLTYELTLSDSTVISNLKLNGNNFVSVTELKAETFVGNTAPVVIKGVNASGEVVVDEEHTDMDFVQIAKYADGKYYLVLIDVPESELKNRKVRSDIDYIAMMSDIELD